MRIVMAVSKDQCMARDFDDDMSWLGPTDKAVFRILTGVGGVLGVSRRSAELMPSSLGGRKLLVLSRTGDGAWGTLKDFHLDYPGGWLIGGPTLALEALMLGWVTEIHLCHSDRMAFPDVYEGSPIRDTLTPWLLNNQATKGLHKDWEISMTTRVLDVNVVMWRPHGDA